MTEIQNLRSMHEETEVAAGCARVGCCCHGCYWTPARARRLLLQKRKAFGDRGCESRSDSYMKQLDVNAPKVSLLRQKFEPGEFNLWVVMPQVIVDPSSCWALCSEARVYTCYFWSW